MEFMEIFEGFEVEEVEVDLDWLVEFVEDIKNKLKALRSKIISFKLNEDGGNWSLWLELTNVSQGNLNFLLSKSFTKDDYEELKFLLRNYVN